MSNEGKSVKVHYVGTLDDGTKFDSSRDRNQPLAFTCMAGQMIPGFDAAVKDMEVGQTVTVKIPAADAYGEHDPKKVLRLTFDMLPGSEKLEVGQHPVLATPDGHQQPCIVVAKDAESITFDMNHELAGKDLTFEIELLEAL